MDPTDTSGFRNLPLGPEFRGGRCCRRVVRLRRRVSPADRRVRLLELTPSGEQLVGELWQQARQTSPVTALTPAERATLASLVSRMLDQAGASIAIRPSAGRRAALSTPR